MITKIRNKTMIQAPVKENLTFTYLVRYRQNIMMGTKEG